MAPLNAISFSKAFCMRITAAFVRRFKSSLALPFDTTTIESEN